MRHRLDRPDLPRWRASLYRGSILVTVLLFSAGYATIGLALVLLAVIVDGVTSRRLPWSRSDLDLLIGLFIGAFLLSAYMSEFRAVAVASTGLAALTIYLSFGPLSRMLRNDQEVVRPLLWTWVVGGMLAALWATVRHLQSGLPAATPALGQNAVGTTMIATTLLGLGLAAADRSRLRLVAASAAVMGAASLLFSYTRGAWLGAVAGLALFMALGGRRVAAIVGVFTIVITLGGAMAAGEERRALVARALTILSPSVNQNRIYLLRAGVAVWRDHPIIGTGMNTFSLLYQRYRLPGDPHSPEDRPNAHNMFVNIGAEGGVLGLGIFLAILAQALRLGFQWRGEAAGPENRILRTAVLAALAGMLVHQVFDGTLISVHLGAGMWMLIAVVTTAPQRDA